MATEVELLLRSNLRPREEVSWTGRPRQGIVLRAFDILLIPVSLAYALHIITRAIAGIIASETALSIAATSAFAALGLCIAGYLVFGRFFADRYFRSKLLYAVTNQRLLIQQDRPFPLLISMDIEFLRNPWVIRYANGRETIVFESSARGFFASMLAPFHAALGGPPQFFQIGDAPEVNELIRRSRQHSFSFVQTPGSGVES